MPATPADVSAATSALPWAMTCCSCWRNSAGAVSAWAAAAFLSARACSNSGSFDCASCGSVTSASAISWLACCLPAARFVCSAGAVLGTAPAAGTATVAPAGSGPIGVTGFGTAFDWSGGASVAASMSLAWPSLPEVTRPLTSPLTSPALPDSLYWSASLSVFGDFASIAALTAAMKAFLSKVPACCASIVSALAACACPATSPAGGSAASWASLALAPAGGCAFLSLATFFTLPVTAAKAGSSAGRTGVGGTGG